METLFAGLFLSDGSQKKKKKINNFRYLRHKSRFRTRGSVHKEIKRNTEKGIKVIVHVMRIYL